MNRFISLLVLVKFYRITPSTTLCVFSIITLLLSFSSPVRGETLTAVCKEPKGRTIGIEGSGKTVDEPDRLRDGPVTLIWEVGKDQAQMLIQDALGGEPLYERATHVHSSWKFDTFIVAYPLAVWFYSIFPQTNRLLITQHTNGYFLDAGGAIAKSLEARCEISLK